MSSGRTPSKNPYVRARVKTSKTADTAHRLAVKPPGVKCSNANGARHLAAPVGQKHRRASPKARASRTPRMGLPKKGDLLLKTPSTYVGRLSTTIDWHRQVGKIYREMRRYQIDPGLGTRLTYVCNIGATLAKFIEETAPVGISIPPDLSRLNDAELQQLEALMAKAAGHQVRRITIDQGNADE